LKKGNSYVFFVHHLGQVMVPHWEKCNSSLALDFPGSAETDVWWGGHSCSSYSRKCSGCFFETQCICM